MTKPLFLALCALILAALVWGFWPKDRSRELKEYARKELILTQKLDSLSDAHKSLLSNDSILTLRYSLRGDSVKQLAKKAGKTTIIYREARSVTDSDSTAENVASELRAARVLITDQESHINGLLALNTQADSLLNLRKVIIENQAGQIQTLSNMFANAKEEGKEAVKQEKKKGNRKFFKGVGVGGLAVLLILLI